jgi:hypothetical protein
MRPTVQSRGSLPAILMNDLGIYEGDLGDYLLPVFTARNSGNPYHNYRHVTHVFFLCYQACMFYADKLTPREMRNLLVAALFHDFDHPGTPGPDTVNIEIAVAGLRRHLLPEDAAHFDDIASLIRATEYPYRMPTENLDLSAQILRDADMSQAMSVAWLQQVVFGLAAEWKMEPIEVLKKQPDFHRALRFHTTWAQQEFPQSSIEEKIAEATELIEIMTSRTKAVAV